MLVRTIYLSLLLTNKTGTAQHEENGGGVETQESMDNACQDRNTLVITSFTDLINGSFDSTIFFNYILPPSLNKSIPRIRARQLY
jgi:hypothetical protein